MRLKKKSLFCAFTALATLAGFLVGGSGARADPLRFGVDITRSSQAPGQSVFGSAQFDAYDPHVSPSTLVPGEVRISIYANETRASVDAIAFNTDLSLSPSRIILPTGWTLSAQTQVNGLGKFSWLAIGDPSVFTPFALISIYGVGANMPLSHILLSSQSSASDTAFLPTLVAAEVNNNFDLRATNFGEHWIYAPAAVAVATPEPSTLVLAAVCFCSLAGGCAIRRRTRAEKISGYGGADKSG